MPERHDGAEVGAEHRLLVEAFETFTRASSELESAYRQLQKQAESLQVELEEKNRELEINLAEKERVKNYLDHILQSLPSGAVVVGPDGSIRLENEQATRIMAAANGGLKELLAVADTGAQIEKEMTLRGNPEPVHLLVRSSPVSLPGGECSESILILTDITRVKKLEEDNRRGERLRVMGEMSCQLAHEIRNPLGSIEIYAALLEKDSPEDSESRRWATSILTSTRLLNNTLTNMLNFPKIIAPHLQPMALCPVIEECLTFVSPLLRQRAVHPDVRLEEDGEGVNGDPELLRQMLLNLVFNSLQAMPRGGTLSIHTQPRGCATGSQREMVLSVADTGRGIPPENLPRIFDPFFTTNRNGNGLGLSIVHTIVERHGGRITVESRLGEGASFEIVLPAVRLEQARRARREATPVQLEL